MVIGNGFFSDTEDDALREMQRRSGCRVVRSNFPTIGNILYYISEHGDLYGVQRIQGKWLTRQRKHVRYSPGWKARLSSAPHKEQHIYVQVLVYCAFVSRQWQPGVELEAVNGDPFDVRPDNFRPKKQETVVPQEWTDAMNARTDVYQSQFLSVCWRVNYVTNLDIDTCKDFVQSAFIYLCTEGYRKVQHDTDIVGLWVKIARFRAIDYLKSHTDRVERMETDWLPTPHPETYEIDLFHLQPGEKRQRYLRMYFEGNQPTEIARECGVSLGSVSSSVTRSLQFMRKYFRKDIEQWNRQRARV